MRVLDTKTIIVNLLNKDKRAYLSVYRLRKLLFYIYKALGEMKQLCNYDICFDIDFGSIEGTVLYNNHIFELDVEGDIIYVRRNKSAEVLAEQYKTDDIILSIIDKFCAIAA